MAHHGSLASIRHLALDLDGTIYRGQTLFPESLPFLAQLREMEIGYTFVTNNSSRSTARYLEKLAHLGIHAMADEVVTSTNATLMYLQEELPQAKRLFVLGAEAQQIEFTAAGYEYVEIGPGVDAVAEDPPEVVVVAIDADLTYGLLCQAAYWIAQGIPFVASHPDVVCPTDAPTVLVDCGSICAALTAATGVEPVAICGKPHRRMMDVVLQRHQLQEAELMMVGDRLNTDVAMALAAGAMGTLVLTGQTSREEVAAAQPKPDLVVENLAELGTMLVAAKPADAPSVNR